MTRDDLKILKNTFGQKTKQWEIAFDEYNSVPEHRKFSMNCRSCWFKVLKWHEEKIEDSEYALYFIKSTEQMLKKNDNSNSRTQR